MSERRSVQNPMIRYATEVGWEYMPSDEVLRLRAGGVILRELFTNQIQNLNSEFMDHNMAAELIRRMERVPPNVEGNLIAWEYLRGLRTIFVPGERRERNVRFIDTDVSRNTFHVTDEFRFSNIRMDVAFLINGIPVLFAETKSSRKLEGIAEALDQVRRYHRDCPELLSIMQMYVLTHLISYYYSATWNTSRKYLYNWRDEAQGDYESLVKAFLDKDRIIRIINDSILFTRKDDELQKVILRPHQMQAVDKLVQRAASDRRHGLVWHTQGSGKTYTMIVTAQKIIQEPIFKNPTIVMLVDRNELESQLYGNLDALGVESEVADSKRELQALLESDRRGIIITLIHKFDEIPANINMRENIFVLVDEAHRTTGGTLGNYLMSALPNATYLGFTGTPIDRTAQGKGTFTVFGVDDPPHGYTDKYSISDSIADGTTVPLHYTIAPNELLVDRETLDAEFWSLAGTEGVSDVAELNKVLQRAVNLRNMLKSEDRVDAVAKYMADHYRNNIEPMGYKAFLVGVDREACALYKAALDKYLPEDYSRVVYSASQGDPPHMSRYHLSEIEEKGIRKDFIRNDTSPRILIVTEKLLTGFDAPILYCMYLDKPMRDHVLLQAIARVNRPYEDSDGRKKPSGFVLDFVGVFDNLERALAFDSQDIEGVVHDMEVLRERFDRLMTVARDEYLSIAVGSQDKVVEAVLEHFRGEEDARHKFYSFFRDVSTIYDILSPDAFLRPYIRDMEELASMYAQVRAAYDTGIVLDREFSRKTAELVQDHTGTGGIRDTLDIYEIDEDTLRRIEESRASDTEKVFNLLRSIHGAIVENAGEQLYLISIGEKAERIAELFKQRQMTTESAMMEVLAIVDEINTARRKQAEMGMPVAVFSIFWVLRSEGIDRPEDKANHMQGILERYPHWLRSDIHERMVKQELIKILVQSGMDDPDRVTQLSHSVMNVLRGGAHDT